MNLEKIAKRMANVFAERLPSISALISYYYWSRTRPVQWPESEQIWLASASKQRLVCDGASLQYYIWGKQGSRILLLHGWNGRATQMRSFIDPLLAQGFQVVALDAPGHGHSDGKHASLASYVNATKKLMQEMGECKGIIAHSFGFMAAVHAVSDNVPVSCLIGLGSPSSFNLLLHAFAISFGLNRSAHKALERYVEKMYNVSMLNTLSVHERVKNINVPILIVHDSADDRVPIREAEKIVNAMSTAELFKTHGLGHVKIIHDSTVVEKCIDFILRVNKG